MRAIQWDKGLSGMLNSQEAIEGRKLIQECLASHVIDIRSGIHQGNTWEGEAWWHWLLCEEGMARIWHPASLFATRSW